MTKQAAVKKGEDMGAKVGVAVGAVTGAAAGLFVAVSCPVIPMILGTLDLMGAGAVGGAMAGGVAGTCVDNKLKK